MPEARDYPLPVFPESFPDLPARGSISLLGGSDKVAVIDQPGSYDLIKVGEGKNFVRFNTGGKDLHVRVKNFEVVGDGTVEVLGGGRLFLYVENTLNLRDKHFNFGGDPMSAVIYYAGSTPLVLGHGFRFEGIIYSKDADVQISGSFGPEAWIISGGNRVNFEGGGTLGPLGLIYAPKARVTMAGSAESGNVIGNSVEVTGGAKVTYRNLNFDRLPLEFLLDSTDIVIEDLEWHLCWKDCLTAAGAGT